MKVLIIEDELLGQQTLMQYLNELDRSILVCGITDSIQASVRWLSDNESPDLILMDIELSDGQCFDIFKQVKVKCPVVFTTSYDEFALKAFSVNGIDYLLKPIKKNELKRSLNKFKELKEQFTRNHSYTNIEGLIQNYIQQTSKIYRKRFLVKKGQRLISFETDEIACFSADNRICYLITYDNTKHIIDYSLEQLENMLEPQEFFRANRSIIIHIRSVVQVHNYFNGKIKVRLKAPADAGELIISRERAGKFKEWMGK